MSAGCGPGVGGGRGEEGQDPEGPRRLGAEEALHDRRPVQGNPPALDHLQRGRIEHLQERPDAMGTTDRCLQLVGPDRGLERILLGPAVADVQQDVGGGDPARSQVRSALQPPRREGQVLTIAARRALRVTRPQRAGVDADLDRGGEPRRRGYRARRRRDRLGGGMQERLVRGGERPRGLRGSAAAPDPQTHHEGDEDRSHQRTLRTIGPEPSPSSSRRPLTVIVVRRIAAVTLLSHLRASSGRSLVSDGFGVGSSRGPRCAPAAAREPPPEAGGLPHRCGG